MLETGSEGLHVYGLLDLVRLYPLVEEGEIAFPSLLSAARGAFRGLGKARFVCFLEEGQALPESVVDAAEDLGLADMVILGAQRLPELLENLFEVTARRAQQSEKTAVPAADREHRPELNTMRRTNAT